MAVSKRKSPQFSHRHRRESGGLKSVPTVVEMPLPLHEQVLALLSKGKIGKALGLVHNAVNSAKPDLLASLEFSTIQRLFFKALESGRFVGDRKTRHQYVGAAASLIMKHVTTDSDRANLFILTTEAGYNRIAKRWFRDDKETSPQRAAA